jgi:hypothetical protein
MLLSAATVASTSAAGGAGGHMITTVAKLTGDPGRGKRPLALDGKGNAYVGVTDQQGAQKVFKVTPSGAVSLFAGTTNTAMPLGAGDGGPATAARLEDICCLAVDAKGDVYIGGSFGYVRKVGSDGKITTIAGAHTGTTFTDGGPATQQVCPAPRSCVDR